MRKLWERISISRATRQMRKHEATLARERELSEIRRFINDDNLFYVADSKGQAVLVGVDKDAEHTKRILKKIIHNRREALLCMSRNGYRQLQSNPRWINADQFSLADYYRQMTLPQISHGHR